MSSRRDPDRTGSVRLAATFLRVGAQNELQYRLNFFVQLFQSLLGVAAALVGLAVVFAHTDNLGGWSRPQLLIVMGIFLIMNGITQAFIQPSMSMLIADIQKGTLDFPLTKPVDAQVLVSVRSVDIWQAADALIGAVILVVGLVEQDASLGLGDVGSFVLLVLMGTVTIYCFWLMLASTAFWLIKTDEMQELFQGLYRTGQYPVGIYPGWLRYGITFVVPLAFAITVPAEALTGRLESIALVGAAGLTAGLLVVSRFLWRRGLRRYAGASA
jgi:ABC-2 type transport system permease protein